MYSMMNATGWGIGFLPFWGLRVLSIVIFGIGVAFLLLWAFKSLSEQMLWKYGWILVVTGTILYLFMFPAWPSWSTGRSGTDDSTQQKEEADGEDLYDKRQSKKKNCADLADSDFELIGEYLMGQRAGASHAQMNAMMQRMMGKDSEEQIHILMGKRMSNCL